MPTSRYLIPLAVLLLLSQSVALAQVGNLHLSLDGDDYAELNEWTPSGQAFTVELWVRPNSTANGQAFISKHRSDGNNRFILGYYNDNLHVNLQGTQFEAIVDQRYTTWHHVAVSVNSSAIRLYVNGDQAGFSSFSGSFDLSGRPWSLGQEWDFDNTSDFFSGSLDNAMLWDKALTGAQIKARYQYARPGDAPNLGDLGLPDRHWRFDTNLRSEYGPSADGTPHGDPSYFWSSLHLVAEEGRFVRTGMRIVSPAGKCLEIEGGATGNGVVQQFACAGVQHQQFALVPYGDGYELRGKQTDNFCVTVEGGLTEGLTTVIQQQCFGLEHPTSPLQTTQQWIFLPVDGETGWFTLRALHDVGRCLTVPEGQANTNGADLRFLTCNASDRQKWFIRPGDTNSPFDSYELSSVYSPFETFCMDAGNAGQGTSVTPQPCLGPDAPQQRFYFETVVGSSMHQVRSAAVPANGLDVRGPSQENGATVQTWPYVGGTNQQWAFVPALDGFQLVANHSGKCATSKADRTDVFQQPCREFTNRAWRLTPNALVVSEEPGPVGSTDSALGAAYPNPFATRTTLGYALSSAQDVRIVAYDVLGREVAVLVEGIQPAGEHEATFDAAALPSGMYLVRFTAGDQAFTRRVTVVR